MDRSIAAVSVGVVAVDPFRVAALLKQTVVVVVAVAVAFGVVCIAAGVGIGLIDDEAQVPAPL